MLRADAENYFTGNDLRSEMLAFEITGHKVFDFADRHRCINAAILTARALDKNFFGHFSPRFCFKFE